MWHSQSQLYIIFSLHNKDYIPSTHCLYIIGTYTKTSDTLAKEWPL